MTSVPLLSPAMMNRSNALHSDPKNTQEASPEFTFSPHMTLANSADLSAADAISTADSMDKHVSAPNALSRGKNKCHSRTEANNFFALGVTCLRQRVKVERTAANPPGVTALAETAT